MWLSYFIQVRRVIMNGIKLESDERFHSLSSGTNGLSLTCCLFDNGQRCTQPSGNASYSQRIAKMVLQRRLKLSPDPTVRIIYGSFKYTLFYSIILVISFSMHMIRASAVVNWSLTITRGEDIKLQKEVFVYNILFDVFCNSVNLKNRVVC